MIATLTQNQAILAILNARWPDGITAAEMVDQIGCYRLASRIHELREDGHVITTETIHRDGKSWAVYRLVIPEAEQRLLWGDR